MRKILIIGAGKSSSYLIKYLLDKSQSENLHITIGDLNIANAKKLIGDHIDTDVIHLDVFNTDSRNAAIQNADIVVSMLPARFHIEVAKDCITYKKHMVTASYVSEEMQALDKDAKANGLIFMNEIGVDPGLDHMSAMQVIDSIRDKGGKMILFESFTGGLVAPESELQRISIESMNGDLALLDGSLKHNNGWFVIRSLVPANTTKGAIQWVITPNTIPDWVADPIVHVSQVGYHPDQEKVAFLELHKNDNNIQEISLQKIEADGQKVTVKKQAPEEWGKYMRYHYLTFDFSEVTGSGMYCIQYGDAQTAFGCI